MCYSWDDLVNQIHHIDLLTLCACLPDDSIDMILCDLPYGTTACSWDVVIPFEPMWAGFKRVIKKRGAIVLTASQPFTTLLISSNLKMFRYEWIWERSHGSGYLNANKMPMKAHENILVFYDGSGTYNPQKTNGKAYSATRGAAGGYVHDKSVAGWVTVNEGNRFPRSVQKFNSVSGLHQTQKPVALFEYLIRTYTQRGEIVLDPCVGSGTTAVAAKSTGRRFICGDNEEKFVEIARERLSMEWKTIEDDTVDYSDLPLFGDDPIGNE
jgi:site-specific DNA-methyltransferase (adenine-specific)